MGVTGTDVAKSAADVILATDNFSYLVNAIEEGRAVTENLRKFITYIFASNVPELMPFLATRLLGIPLALSVIQILSIDLGTDLLPALALGAERPEPGIMRRPPRRGNQPLVDRSLLLRSFAWLGPLEAFFCFLGFFGVYALTLPMPEPFSVRAFLETVDQAPPAITALAATVYFAAVIFTQAGNAFACRSETQPSSRLGWLSNHWLLGAIALEIAVLGMLLVFPPLTRIYGHSMLPLPAWLYLLVSGLALYSLEWVRKRIVRWLASPSANNLLRRRTGL
jgi:Ca2+-transporting ATPase